MLSNIRNMMMTQSYYSGGELGPPYRQHHRNMPTAAYYDRVAPYAYYDHVRPDLRQEYMDRQPDHAIIHEPDENAQVEQPRRRIAVAVCTTESDGDMN